MNYRDYKKLAKGEYYHLYNRGVGKMNIFSDSDDYDLLVARIKEALFPADGAHLQGRYQRKKLPENAFALVCYTLMPNHFHLLIRQNTDLPLSAFMLNVFGGYSKCFNKKYGRVGSLFQDQFKSIHISNNEYLLWLSAYIHANPALAGLVQKAQDYPFGSYSEYLGNSSNSICDKDVILSQFKSPQEYRQFLEDAVGVIRSRKDMEHLLLESEA